MSKYIDAEELLAWYDDFRKREREVLLENYHKERKDEARIKISTLDKVYFKVQELKDNAADVEEVRHGEWVEDFMIGEGVYRCTNCDDKFVTLEGTPYDNRLFYCPFCGAKMDKKEKTDGET